jgi:hypothetical protein
MLCTFCIEHELKNGNAGTNVLIAQDILCYIAMYVVYMFAIGMKND